MALLALHSVYMSVVASLCAADKKFMVIQPYEMAPLERSGRASLIRLVAILLIMIYEDTNTAKVILEPGWWSIDSEIIGQAASPVP
jgi:hypothetical protein